MNIQAAFKTLLVVLAIGAITGFTDWQRNYGGAQAERTAREVSGCVKDGEQAAYRAHPTPGGGPIEQRNRQIEADCRDLVQSKLANKGLPAYLIDTESRAGKGAAKQAGPARLTPEQIGASDKTWCLAKIEEARKRSPGGLNPEWEKGERNRCDKTNIYY